jgi:hypothetical protein
MYTIYYKTFLRDEIIENEWIESVKLTPTECLMMVQFKKCGTFQMTCVADGSCQYEGERKPNYDWLKPHTGVVYSCKIFKRVIVAADTSSTLFGVTGCSALQGHCSLKESIVTWIPTDIIDECPYERLLYTELAIDGNDVLIDSKNSLLFKVNGLETLKCRTHQDGTTTLRVFTTAEGLMLSIDELWHSFPLINGSSLLVANEFLLADRDFEGRKLYRLYDHISEQLCLIFLSTLRALSRLVDEYVRIEDNSGNKIIVYADSGNLYVPTCTKVNTTYILTNNFSNCYEDLPVVFDYFNRNVTAFLTTDLILRPTSRRIDCKDIKSRYFFLPATNLLLHQVGSVLTFGRRDDVLWQSLDTSNIMLSQANSIKHYHGTLDGLDVLSMIPEYTQFDEMGVSFTALDKEPDPMTPQ